MKKGITLTLLVTSVIIMAILIGSTIIFSMKSIKTVNYEKFKVEYNNLVDLVNLYYLENNELPVTNEIISSSISKSLNNQVKMNRDNFSNLRVININLLKNLNVKLGKGNLNNRDIFVISEESHNIYYVKGYKHNNKIEHKI